ncbi:LacI family DNA-binding transcriptional regulator [Victivallis sp. Marseille-Q1083]|uniref:LacI family DNA-binding transcriptional regulator n=1 Tax=Victivallis sp. Marseille-Q1083 TaxID=2717288 RepID=UPI00158CA3CC|nr:LacI family DNA-binding transcriptional regulator [Victivallis sp. Marseille-Q1083]
MFPAAKPATLKDIASRLGISCRAVSMGINGTGRLSAATREKILATARELDYVPNVVARSLVMRKSYLIGAVVPYINKSFFANIIAGIEDVVFERDFSLILANFYPGIENERQAFRHLLKRKIDGVVITPGKDLIEDYCELAAAMPVVQIMDHLPEVGSHFVMVDNDRGARTAARHLLELGHRRIGLICHKDEPLPIRQRQAGFCDELKKAGYELSREYIEDGQMSILGGETAAHRLLARAPELTALFAVSDYAALGAIRAALKMEYRIPEDLSVIGFDDLEIAAEQLLYPLTTIAQPKEEIGHLAGNMLLDLLQGKATASRLLDAPLVVRATTAPCKKDSFGA